MKLILNAQPDIEVIGDACDGREAVEKGIKLRPDVMLMDVSMPHLNGLKATERLIGAWPKAKILILTRHKDHGYLQQLLRAGASGYVLKQSPSAELLHAIRAIVAGGKYLDPQVAGKVMGTFVRPTTVDPASHEVITDREAEVLKLISFGYSNKDIANELGLSIKTIEAHKANAMRKLGMASRIDIVRYAVLRGWLQEH